MSWRARQSAVEILVLHLPLGPWKMPVASSVEWGQEYGACDLSVKSKMNVYGLRITARELSGSPVNNTTSASASAWETEGGGVIFSKAK